jgi:ribonucleoside-diphosphate reductase alpha chain
VLSSSPSTTRWTRSSTGTVEEGTIFKGGLRLGHQPVAIPSSQELPQGRRHRVGPVSFMRGADASAGTIKSGGKTRRAAKMVILNATTPTSRSSSGARPVEEQKARVLRDAGFDMDLDGRDSHSTQYQNANNSVRVTDEFMQAVVDDADWHLRAVITGDVVKTVRARDLMRQISQASWECADPGHAVRHHDQPLAHRRDDRPHQRKQPLQ